MNKKEVCPECKRTLRTKCFVFNVLVKKRICKRCHKKIGTNKFYVPFKERRDFIGKYSITKEEKNRLFGKFVREGLGEKAAWQKVYSHVKLLGIERKKSRYTDKQRKRYFAIKAKEKVGKQKKFLEGLK